MVRLVTPRLSTIARYTFAVLAVILASFLRETLVSVLGEGVPFILFFPTVALAAWLGGFWPGMLSAVLGGFIAWYFFIPHHLSFSVSDPTTFGQITVFFLASTFICLLAQALHDAIQSAHAGELREREQREHFRVTLTSIGDAVIATEAEGRITFMNPVAESLTGWTEREASGRPLTEIFKIVNEETGEPVDNPALRALREGVVVGLANHTVLITKNGDQRPIDDSAAPICLEKTTTGAVLVFRDISQRRAAECQLFESRERLRITLGSIGDAVVATDAQGRVTYANLVAENILGYTLDRAIGRPLAEVFNIVNEITRSSVENPVERVLREDKVVGLANHTILLRPDGAEVPIDDSAAPIRDDSGRIVGVVLVFRDISERRRAEKALATLAAIVESSEDAIISKDLNGHIMTWNAGAERLFGYREEEVVGRPITLLIPTDRIDEETRILERIRNGERVESYETVRLKKNGTSLDISLTVSPVKGPDGTIIGASKIARDISERKQMEPRRNASFAITQILAESPSLSDATPRILQTIGEQLGWEVGEMWIPDRNTASLCCQTVWRDPSARVEKFIDASYRSTFAPGVGLPGRVWASLKPAWIPDLGTDDICLRAAIALDVGLQGGFAFPIMFGDKFLGVMDFFSREIREPDEGLVDIFASIGSQIGQFMQRKQAEEALREADHRKDEFLAMLGHELRNPLGVIHTVVQLLARREPLDPTVKEFRSTIELEVKQMARLLDDLLDISRIGRGLIRLNKEPCDFAAIVRQVAESRRPLLEEAGLHLSVDLPEEPLWVIGDRTRFAQIVGNLLHNASKFTNEGGHVSVQLSRRPGERSAMLSIRDTGVGIEPELLPRVFEPFVQAEQNLARSRGGLGLGLALVKALVDLQEGQVSAASDGLGRGAEFTVRLPLVHAPAAQDRKQTDLPDKTHRSYRILIIEDNQVAAKNTQIFLAEDGHTVQTAYTGSSGIEAARRFQPEVVLCDIGLPGIDGYAVAQALRQEVGLKQVYLIAITGYGQDENLRRAVDAGFDAYLVKPVDFAALEEKLANLSLKNPVRALHGSSAS